MPIYIARRLLITLPTALSISFILFALLDFAPNDPTAHLPVTIPPEVREGIRAAMGLDQPLLTRYALWLRQFFVYEPLNLLEVWLGSPIGDSTTRVRLLSWTTRGPVVDLIAERLPQTLWVVGLSYLLAIVIAVPLGALSAHKRGSWMDRLCTLLSAVGHSVPTFFVGVLLIVVFSVKLQWLPSVYNTNHRVVDLPSFWFQLKQMCMPVLVMTLYNVAQVARLMRATVLDQLQQDYVRTAYAKGLSPRYILFVHILPNALAPVVTVLAMTAPLVFGGAVVTEQVFRINGIGQLLISGLQSSDIPLVQTVVFLMALLIVLFNLFADILYGVLDPRVRYD